MRLAKLLAVVAATAAVVTGIVSPEPFGGTSAFASSPTNYGALVEFGAITSFSSSSVVTNVSASNDPSQLFVTTQPPPAPQILREDGTIPGMQPGQALGTRAGERVDVMIRVDQNTGQTLIDGLDWSFQVSVAGKGSFAEETAGGGALVTIVRGATATITGNGFIPLSRADVWLFSDPTLLGTINIDENGELAGEVSIDGRVIPVGDHTLQLQGVGVDGFILAANLGVVVTDPVESTPAATTDASATFLWWIVALIALLVMAAVVWWAVSRR